MNEPPVKSTLPGSLLFTLYHIAPPLLPPPLTLLPINSVSVAEKRRLLPPTAPPKPVRTLSENVAPVTVQSIELLPKYARSVLPFKIAPS